MNTTQKIAAVMAALMIASACPAVNNSDTFTFGIECSAAETTLSAPGNVAAQVKDNTVTLSWDKVKGADAYRIYKYDAAKKKYVKYKSIKGNKIVIKELEEGASYKFKVAAMTKSGKTYKAGTASKTVTVNIGTTEKAPSAKEQKKEFKEVKLSAKEMAGAWEYYDFRYLTDISKASTYDPAKKEWTGSGWIEAIQFITAKNVIIKYQDITENCELKASSRKIGNNSYKIYTDGTEYYLFYSFKNGDGNNTYIFRKKALPNFEKVSDASLLSGNWTTVDFCTNELTDKITYDPTSPVWAYDQYLISAQVNGKKITFYYSDGAQSTHNITAAKIDTAKYFVYSAGDDMYMYYQWKNGDGDKQFYVLKKAK